MKHFYILFCSLGMIFAHTQNAVAANNAELSSMSFGSMITCSTDQFANHAHGFTELLTGANCDNNLSISIKGVGLGFRNSGSFIAVLCSNPDPQGIYYGMKLNADFMAGITAGVFASESGTCLLVGADIGMGASIMGSKLIIR